MDCLRFSVLGFRLLTRGFGRCRCSLFRAWLVGVRLPPGLRQSTAARINTLVNGLSTQGIHTFNKHPFDEFVIEQTPAINEFVQHPRGNLLRLDLMAGWRGRRLWGFGPRNLNLTLRLSQLGQARLNG